MHCWKQIQCNNCSLMGAALGQPPTSQLTASTVVKVSVQLTFFTESKIHVPCLSFPKSEPTFSQKRLRTNQACFFAWRPKTETQHGQKSMRH